MVRLKEKHKPSARVRVCYFNSTMVRLKEERFKDIDNYMQLFQFHYGTIKRQWESPNPSTFNVFQFHYGTIKRSASNKLVLSYVTFQFHYGTIKRDYAGKVSKLLYVFQFHYGTIKSNRRFQLPESYAISIPLWYD